MSDPDFPTRGQSCATERLQWDNTLVVGCCPNLVEANGRDTSGTGASSELTEHVVNIYSTVGWAHANGTVVCNHLGQYVQDRLS
jgi:hypothetical protein